jgi:hypothetical protein
MRKSHWLAIGLATLSLAFSVSLASAQKVQVSVLYRQDSDAIYRAIVPGYSGPNADVTGACLLDPDPVNCPDSDQTGPANYILAGATLSLGLPDGRIAVVNCVNRYSAKGNYVNRRSCGMPMVDRVEAEFNGKRARLTWRVGPDGKKTESETYKVVALLAKPTESARVSTGDRPGSR